MPSKVGYIKINLGHAVRVLNDTLDGTTMELRHEKKDDFEWASNTPVMKSLAGTYLLGLNTRCVRPILNYTVLVWFTKVSFTHLG